ARQCETNQSARNLSRTQLNDHIPEILDAFESRLRELGNGKVESTEEEVEGTDKHGLHRWQQGYQLPELVTEWGHLYECVLNEVEDFAASHPQAPREVMRECRSTLTTLYLSGVAKSTAKYFELYQKEAQ